MYRAHLLIDTPRATRARIEREFELPFKHMTAGVTACWVGTRQGEPGIWIETSHRANFRFAMDRVVRYAVETGYFIRITTTNAPSQTSALNAVLARAIPDIGRYCRAERG